MADNSNWRKNFDSDDRQEFNRSYRDPLSEDERDYRYRGNWNYRSDYEREVPHTDERGRTGDDMNRHRSFSGDYNYSGNDNRRYDQGNYRGDKASSNSDYRRYGNEYNAGPSGYGDNDYRSDYDRYGDDYNRGRSDSGFESGNYGNSYGQSYDQGGYNRNRGGSEFEHGGSDRTGNRSQYSYDRYGRRYDERAGSGSADVWESGASFNRQNRGKGPKGYRRSEERIREDVCDRLADAYQLDASEIEVKVEGNTVTLSGTVTDKNQKRIAEDIVEDVSGVQDVENNIRVNKGGSGNSADANSSGTIL